MASSPGVALLLCLVGSAASMVLCPENLAELAAPNCGTDDPECPLEPPFHKVNISHDGVFRYVETSYCPPYDWSCLSNPKGRRPCARRNTFKVPMYPGIASGEKISLGLGWQRGIDSGQGKALADLPGPRIEDVKAKMLGALGVLVNGVVLNTVNTKLTDAMPAEQVAAQKSKGDKWVDAGLAEEWMNDGCDGHLSGGGNYHVHAGRWSPEQRKSCGLPVDAQGQHSELLGWAFDGYGMYGPLDFGGEPIQAKDVDGCGGHSQETLGGYHYHLTDRYPYSLECYHGCPEPSNNGRFKDQECQLEPAVARPLQPPPASGQHAEL